MASPCFVCTYAKMFVFVRTREGVNFTNILQAAFMHEDPKIEKKDSQVKHLFALSGSERVKAGRKSCVRKLCVNALMKLTQGEEERFPHHYPDFHARLELWKSLKVELRESKKKKSVIFCIVVDVVVAAVVVVVVCCVRDTNFFLAEQRGTVHGTYFTHTPQHNTIWKQNVKVQVNIIIMIRPLIVVMCN